MTLKLHERSNVHDQEDQETEGAEIFPVDLIKQLLTGSEQGWRVDSRRVRNGGAQQSAGGTRQFWLKVSNDLKRRGLKNILIAATDGLCCRPEAIEVVYRQAQIQACIGHLIRNS